MCYICIYLHEVWLCCSLLHVYADVLFSGMCLANVHADVLSSGTYVCRCVTLRHVCVLMWYPPACMCDDVLFQPYSDTSYPVRGTWDYSVE